MDTIGDFLTIIRNANRVRKRHCCVAFSKIRQSIALLLKKEGYITDVQEATDEQGFACLVIVLKYVKGCPVLNVLERCSKPGARWYVNHEHIPSVLSGLGICVLSTSKGIMTGVQAKKMGVGGELICKVW
ncbi:MAG: 30S ribosomal protein S8 [Opitutales bacterium]|nr:30S ribosomal protein S8 [Opitutales bacterium]